MKLFVVLALVAAAVAEPEAKPALLYSSYVSSPLAATTPCGPSGCYHSPVVRDVASPGVKTVATPPVVKYVANPMVKTVAAPVVATPFAPAVASHTITSYNSPTHYTAVSNGVFGPSYVAKNGVVQHVVKREAEAEADPTLVYTNVMSPFPSTYSVASPLTTTFNHAVPAYHHLTVAAPLATNGA